MLKWQIRKLIILAVVTAFPVALAAVCGNFTW
jgi:hypothetical protein